jgi:hypothetical protein
MVRFFWRQMPAMMCFCFCWRKKGFKVVTIHLLPLYLTSRSYGYAILAEKACNDNALVETSCVGGNFSWDHPAVPRLYSPLTRVWLCFSSWTTNYICPLSCCEVPWALLAPAPWLSRERYERKKHHLAPSAHKASVSWRSIHYEASECMAGWYCKLLPCNQWWAVRRQERLTSVSCVHLLASLLTRHQRVASRTLEVARGVERMLIMPKAYHGMDFHGLWTDIMIKWPSKFRNVKQQDPPKSTSTIFRQLIIEWYGR